MSVATLVAWTITLIAIFVAARARGKTAQVQAVMVDSVEAVDRERRMLAAILDALPVAVFIADSTGRLTHSNPASLRMWGGAAPLVGPDQYATYKAWFPETGRQLTNEDWALSRTLATGVTVVAEPVDIERFDGTRGHVLNSTAALRDAHGNIVGAMAVLLDVTPQVAAENDKKLLTRELERSNAELERFAYVASHDLQEPLRLIASFAQLLGKRYTGRLDADADEFIGYVVDAAQRMQNLIRDLLAYSRLGALPIRRTMVDTNALLDEVLDGLRMALEESNGRVTRGLMPVVYADRTHFQQILQNLVGNALKFRGRENADVFVGAREGPDRWTFEVRDTGIGINEKYATKIFEVFQRLHGIGEYTGTGIGLSICKKLVEKHGGTIWVESVENEGSTFFFTIAKEDTAWPTLHNSRHAE